MNPFFPPRHTGAAELISAGFCISLPLLLLFHAPVPLFLAGGIQPVLHGLPVIGLLHAGAILGGGACYVLRLAVLPVAAGLWAHLVTLSVLYPVLQVLLPVAVPMALLMAWAFILHFGIRPDRKPANPARTG